MLALLLALALPAGQQAGSPPTPSRPTVRVDISPAGQATVQKFMSGSDPNLEAMAKQLQGIAGQLDTISRAPKLDMVKLEALVHRQEQLENGIRVGTNARMLAMLKALSESDRAVFMRTMADARRASMQKSGGQR